MIKTVKTSKKMIYALCRKSAENAEKMPKIAPKFLMLIFVCVGSKNKNLKNQKIKKLSTSFKKIKIFFLNFFINFLKF